MSYLPTLIVSSGFTDLELHRFENMFGDLSLDLYSVYIRLNEYIDMNNGDLDQAVYDVCDETLEFVERNIGLDSAQATILDSLMRNLMQSVYDAILTTEYTFYNEHVYTHYRFLTMLNRHTSAWADRQVVARKYLPCPV